MPATLDPPAWAVWAAIAVSVVVGLAALRWLVAQAVRVPAGSTWQLADDQRAGITVLGTADAAAPLAEELSAQAGVRSATARLTGRTPTPLCTCASRPTTARRWSTCAGTSTRRPYPDWSAHWNSRRSTPTCSCA